MILCIIPSLEYMLSQEVLPLRGNTCILFLDRFRHIMKQEEMMLNSVLISSQYDNRLDRERKIRPH